MNFYQTEAMHDSNSTLTDLLTELGEALECREYLEEEGYTDINVEKRLGVIKEMLATYGVKIELPFTYI